VLQHWFSSTLDRPSAVTISDLVVPPTGFSGDQIAFHVEWRHEGVTGENDFVVRLEARPDRRVFLDTNFAEQYQILRALNSVPGMPVPKVRYFVDDESLLGARFYVMEKLAGQPAAYQTEWFQKLNEGARSDVWWRGLTTMACLHRVDPRELAFVGKLAATTWDASAVLDRQLECQRAFYEWARGGDRFPATEEAFEWLYANKPIDSQITLQWGDARLGNLLFDESRNCRGMVDWEQAEIGFAEADLGYWLMNDGHDSLLPSAMGVSRVRISNAETIMRYEHLLGKPLTDMRYWEIFGLVRASPIVVRLGSLARAHNFSYHRRGNDPEAALGKLLKYMN
jgi:aminoglycoside phosphotransferase (APT) family kinase protein